MEPSRAAQADQIFQLLFKPMLWALFWMSLLRLGLVFDLNRHFLLHPDFPVALLAGVRFDLLVLGFFWIPVWPIIWFSAGVLEPQKVFPFVKWFLFLGLAFFCLLSWLDYFWMAVHGSRIHAAFQWSDLISVVQNGWRRVGFFHALSFGFLVIVAIRHLHSLLALQPWVRPNSLHLSKVQTAVRVVITLFLVALAARGTWTPHHLNIEHAQVSRNPKINQIPLNALWNLDKD